MLTKQQQMVLIRSGREAIEHAMLSVVLRSFAGPKSDQKELDELSQLLRTYNRLMAKHQQSLIASEASNAETNKQEK